MGYKMCFGSLFKGKQKLNRNSTQSYEDEVFVMEEKSTDEQCRVKYTSSQSADKLISEVSHSKYGDLE